jgi:nitroimidazol reductase NimA-like FMN-containing flavoprotein (pyridoxamine 5'-phosphate oxidase superfamily)
MISVITTPFLQKLVVISRRFLLQDTTDNEQCGDIMDPVKIPRMTKTEYDALIERQCVSRISFGACEHPYIAPFMYVFDKKYLYFLSTKYGRKMEYFAKNPKVSVEIEEYAPDMSVFSFVSLQGTLEEVQDPAGKKKIREQFVEMIARKKLSPHVLTALGHRPSDRPDVLVNEERSLVWKLVGVKDIIALKNG